MFRNCLKYCAIILLWCFTLLNAATAADLEEQLAAVNQQIADTNESALLSEEQKKNDLAFLNQQLELYTRLQSLQNEQASFDQQLTDAEQIISELETSLAQANTDYGDEVPPITDLDGAGISDLITSLQTEQQTVQAELNTASSELTTWQALPTKAQESIQQNNERAGALNLRLTQADDSLSALERQTIELELSVIETENSLLQGKLRSQTSFQDIANYKVKINTLKNKWLTNYLRAAQTYQNQISTEGVLKAADTTSDLQDIPELQEQLNINLKMTSILDSQLKDNLQLAEEYQDVEQALTEIKQIEQTINEQINQLNGSFILSRMLNRQQSEIQDIRISFNLDEFIPNMNIWLYDLRTYRDKIFDVKTYVDNLIQKQPSLEAFRDELEQVVKQRRTLYDKLYQAMSAALTQAINLKLRYEEYRKISADVTDQINDNLFWLASNQAVTPDLFINLPNLLQLQFKDAGDLLAGHGGIGGLIRDLLLLTLPPLLLAFLLYLAQPRLRRLDNQLALRLDKETDSYWVTPYALLVRLLSVVPQSLILISIGSLFIFVAVSDGFNQHILLLLLILHTIILVYCVDILKSNSIAQRHFCVRPEVLRLQHSTIAGCYLAIIPILYIANMRELEPTKISNDVIGFFIMLACAVYLTFFALRNLKQRFTEAELTWGSWLISCICIGIPLCLVIMLCLGYYYTAIKLINRVAYTCYIGLGYLLICSTIRRALYVAEMRMTRSAIARLKAKEKNAGSPAKAGADEPKTRRQEQLDTLRFEIINSKAFKLIRTALLCITAVLMYAQWSDLASVFSYLNTVDLWQDVSMVDGTEVISARLTVADILKALIVLAVTFILYRNLPAVIERLMMIKGGLGHKSTSYTMKIIASYVIVVIGLIFAAGSLGITWDNLQWLIAALSVGLGFGLQEIFANFVSGIIILFERQLRVGDIVTISDLSGTVSKIRIRATTIISFDNKEVMVPNRQFITSALTNWSLSNTVTLLEFEVGVAYGSNVALAKQILDDIVHRCKYLETEKAPRIFVKSLDDSAVSILCEVFVKEIGNRKATYDFLSTETLKLFAKSGIEIPYNKLDVCVTNLDNGKKLKLPA